MSKILGVGVDIVEVKRFKEKPYNKNKKFYEKIFLNSEIEYCLKFKSASEHFAGKFALKEAVKKALDENISTEYENITRIYFLNLQEKALNESNK